MKRLLMLFAGLISLSPVPAQSHPYQIDPSPRNPDNFARMQADAALFHERSQQINELAGKMQSLDDSRRMADLIAAIFADDLPPGWVTRPVRDRVARAEFETAGVHGTPIPEQRVVDAWNRYITTIGASQDAIVTVAEIHNLRDGLYTSARFFWSRGNRDIWSAPNIYATGPDGKVADGCTAVEILRVFYDLSNQFGNLRGARERVRLGVMISDTVKPLPEAAAHVTMKASVSGGAVARDNPVEDAEIRYVREHGLPMLNHAVVALLDDLFPS